MSFYEGPRDPEAPFFMDRDRTRPYTYTNASKDLKSALGRASTDTNFGLHGFRVTGYNESKEANGEDVTVAHGGWKPGSNSRYDRFSLSVVFGMARRMLGARVRVEVGSDGEELVAEEEADGAPQPRELTRAVVHRRRASAAEVAAASPGPSPSAAPHVAFVRRLLRSSGAATSAAEPAAAAAASPYSQ